MTAPIRGALPKPRRKLVLASDLQPIIDALNGMTGDGISVSVSPEGIKLSLTARNSIPEGFAVISAVLVRNGTTAYDAEILIRAPSA